jgi:sugar/nucleoside kinase (ribokinase family)
MSISFHIIGDAFADLFCFLQDGLPKAGGDAILTDPVQRFVGGSAINTATHLASIAGERTERGLCNTTTKVIVYTALNPKDEYGKLLLDHATQIPLLELVNCRQPLSSQSTGHCIAMVAQRERTFLTHRGCVTEFKASNVDAVRIIHRAECVHVHIAGYFNMEGFWNGALQKQIDVIKEGRKKLYPGRSATFSLVCQHDASNEWNGGIDSLMRSLDFVILNELEATSLLSRLQSKPIRDDYFDDLKPLFSKLSEKTVFVVTRGSNGAIAFRNGVVLAQVNKSVAVQVVDPTGAGDAFAAGFLQGVFEWKSVNCGLDVEEAWTAKAIEHGLSLGCATGTASIQTKGASIPSSCSVIENILQKQKSSAASGERT